MRKTGRKLGTKLLHQILLRIGGDVRRYAEIVRLSASVHSVAVDC